MCIGKMISNDIQDFMDGYVFDPNHLANSYIFFVVKGMTYRTPWEYVPKTGIIELVISSSEPENGLEIGSYTPLEKFTLRAVDTHIMEADTTGNVTVSVRKVTDGISSDVGTFYYSEGEGSLSLLDPTTEILPNDILVFTVEDCPNDCDRITITVSAYFG